MEATRNQVFQKVQTLLQNHVRPRHLTENSQLKPPCVELNQVVLRFKTKSATSKDVLRALENLHGVLLGVSRQEYALDEKLAEYVFFPLSHIFRETREVPSRVLELALQCLRILLESAWRHKLSASLGIQLLILLGFIAGGNQAQGKSKETSEELGLVVLECLHSLFDSLGRSVEGRRALTDATNVPALGHTVTVLLDRITDGLSDKSQLAALAALDALLSCLGDREAIASFFPGMVSSLTKALQTTTRSKRSYRFLQAGIGLLNRLLRLVLSDDAVTELSKRSTDIGKGASHDAKGFGLSWAKATAAQVKLALANVIRLRNHDRKEVRQALHELCITVLETCKETMTDSRTMMIETLITLSATDAMKGDLKGQTALKQLAYTDSGLVGLIKTSVHNWTLSSPRIMQTNDDSAKARIAGQISTSIKLLSALEQHTDMLDYDVAMSLRDSVLSIVPAQTALNGSQNQRESSLQLVSADGQEPSISFSPILMSKKAEQETLLTLSTMVARLSDSSSSSAVVRTMLDEARASTGKALLANFWVALNFLRNTSTSTDDIDVFLDLEPSTPDPRANLLEELYSLSIRILTDNNNDNDKDEPDWRLQGLALEAIALQAHRLREQFRPELVDALYPIVQLLASPHPSLRSHAITCLNLISTSSNYASPSALIIANVDYLVNAVGLKLNTFDISPQAPQVLLMMIRLCGASLIPYLDDLIASVFAALDCFHGYPQLVELLFEVLGAIVDEGAKASVLAITDGNTSRPNHRKPPLRPRTVSDVARELAHARTRKQTATATATDADLSPPDEPTSVPPEPHSSSSTDLSPPLPKPTQTLLSITTLTRHYLPHASPSLRTHLLHLIATALPPLSTYDNSLLPLVATLWPLVARRLLDPEPYVVIAAAEALAAMSVCAGEFVASRVEAGWGEWMALVRRVGVEKGGRRGGGGRGGRGVYRVGYRVWDALVSMLVVVLGHVRVSEEMVDEVLEVVRGEGLEARSDLREVLEGLNPDAVWLVMERRRWRDGKGGGAGWRDVPTVEGFVFKAVEF